ncbi:MAG TPA: hypothetical protein VG223_03645 [Solirubrobacteraceae bacterium]|jgi:hypothetical protein|nr:hypothetical protein [Solirubrobacteraceae bacterium]
MGPLGRIAAGRRRAVQDGAPRMTPDLIGALGALPVQRKTGADTPELSRALDDARKRLRSSIPRQPR